ncbi:MAG: hypothetical protein K9G33_12125 [Sneathiella sp.]|nr:hypothetical protein [Sneathiella sp.]
MSLKMDPIQASSAEELLSLLRQQDITVPSRGLGQNKNHIEIDTACHLLSTLAATDHLRFPVQIIHRDKPDFLVESGYQKIGVEVTESTDQQYSDYHALRNQKFQNAFIEPAHFGKNKLDRTPKERRELLRQKKLTSPGWKGDQPEQDWAEYINDSICGKLKKLAARDFEKFEKNWLSLDDNLPYAALDINLAVSYLLPKIGKIWSLDPKFHAIFVESGNEIVRITANGTEILPINNLWEKS